MAKIQPITFDVSVNKEVLHAIRLNRIGVAAALCLSTAAVWLAVLL